MKEDIQLKDVLRYYLGCEVMGTGKKPGSKHYTLVGFTFDGGYLFRTIPEGFSIDLGHDWKPILRSLDSMTDEDIKEMPFKNYPDFENKKFTVEQFHYLLSKRPYPFDLFKLIQRNLAIDKNKMQYISQGGIKINYEKS